MTARDLKYLLVWLLPLFACCGLYMGSWYSPGSFYLAFILVPILDALFPMYEDNFTEPTKKIRADNAFFDVLLLLNLPVLFALLFYFIYTISKVPHSAPEQIFLCLNMGIALGVLGINVAHELGHRQSLFAKIIAQLLLLPCLYMHFTKEHNYWHHKYVASAKDPSSAKLNEPLYTFWLRSISGVWKNAWQIEKRSLSARGLPWFHWRNVLLLKIGLQLSYLIAVFIYGGICAVLAALVAAFISILLLETINYIEHYGLLRSVSAQGKLEPVREKHSWNSNHSLGRIFLYELTRHPQHHQNAGVKYQNLENIRNSPQMKYGYPASMLLAMIPPLWFKIMNPKLDSAPARF